MLQNSTLVLGIGNTLLTDEGAGVHAMNALQSILDPHPDFTFIDGGTLSFTLAHHIEDCCNLIVFDAAELKAEAGTVSTFVNGNMDHFLGTTKRSPHEVGLLDLMDIARITDSLPSNRALIGIQPGSMDWGTSPSTAVKQGLNEALQQAMDLLEMWEVVDAHQYSRISSCVNVHGNHLLENNDVLR